MGRPPRKAADVKISLPFLKHQNTREAPRATREWVVGECHYNVLMEKSHCEIFFRSFFFFWSCTRFRADAKLKGVIIKRHVLAVWVKAGSYLQRSLYMCRVWLRVCLLPL